jgi:uncharacterized membrane protein
LRHVPGLGVLVLVRGLLLTGCSSPTSSASGGCSSGTASCSKIPIVKSIYSSVKQVSDTLFSSSGNAFREAVLVQYPRQGSWTIAFVTGKPGGEVAAQAARRHVSLYVPTTPNPTSGFFLMMPRADVRPCDERGRGAQVRHLDGRGGTPPPPRPAAVARN